MNVDMLGNWSPFSFVWLNVESISSRERPLVSMMKIAEHANNGVVEIARIKNVFHLKLASMDGVAGDSVKLHSHCDDASSVRPISRVRLGNRRDRKQTSK